jgi:hypothetical protein
MGKGTGKGIAMLVAGLVVGGIVGYAAAPRPSGVGLQSPPSKGTYEDGYKAAKKELEDLRVIAPEQETMTEVVGNITEVKDASFTMSVDASTVNPLVQGVPMRREVVLTKDTKITGMVKKDPAVYAKEAKDYDKKFAAAAAAGEALKDPPPSQFVEKTLTIKDLVQGDHVTVTAASNVKTAEKFEAVSVAVGYSSFQVSAPPPPEGAKPVSGTPPPAIPLPPPEPTR